MRRSLRTRPVVRAGITLLAAAALLSSADIPRQAPALTVPAAGGKQIDLSQYRGKVVALEFLLTTCPHCQKCSQIMEKLYKEYGSRGFQPLGVAINDMAHMLVPDYIRQFQLSYPIGWSGRDTAVKFLQHPVMMQLMMPQLVFIDKGGAIRAQYGGNDQFFSDEEKNMRVMVESLLKESGAKKGASGSGKSAPKKTS